MYTRWRLYILAVLLGMLALCLLLIRFLNKRGMHFNLFRSMLLVLGVLLTTESIITLTLSNFNLGVILPGIFGIPLIVLSFALPYMKSGLPAVVKWIALAGYVIACIVFLVCGILMMISAGKSKKMDANALIVLGAAVHGDKVTWVLENRLNKVIDYLNAHPDCICVVSGGQGDGETVPEASAMRLYLLNHEISDDRIIVEDRATNTTENFVFSNEKLRALPERHDPIGFVTTDFHVFRAEKVAAANGIQAVGIPAPDVWYLRLNNFMRECVAICVYKLTGRI